jgi:hypothetical protein
MLAVEASFFVAVGVRHESVAVAMKASHPTFAVAIATNDAT